MTATNHAATGALIAVLVNEPLLAIPIAFASHFVLDALPHFGLSVEKEDSSYRQKYIKVLTVDLCIALLLLITLPIILSQVVDWRLTLICIVLAAGADLVWGWRYFKLKDFKKVSSPPMSKLTEFHQKIQRSETPKGGLVELSWLVVSLGAIYYLS